MVHFTPRCWRRYLVNLGISLLCFLVCNCDAQQRRHPPKFEDYDLTNVTYFPRRLSLPDDPPTIEEVSPSNPRVYLIHNALTRSECGHIRRLASKTLRPSYVGTGGQGMKTSERRTSESTFLMTGSVFETGPMRDMRRRISRLTGLDVRRFADLQVNKYKPGGKYEPHLDWAASGGASEQDWTVLLCLSTAEEGQGGETLFPRANIAVRPREGMAIVFRNIIEPGKPDLESLHGGGPLADGEKWNANQWVFTQELPFARRVSLPVLLRPWGGDPPNFVVRLRNYLMRKYGAERGYRALNQIADAIFGGLAFCSAVMVPFLVKLLKVSKW
eukprot:CAMPEP_0113559684 /NCGR_PEP_ID=MMETSP0015_2-20120614/19029_1 /TAXON_ID=2838 /ORGANISM="Odontella" /LENGTH=328 /DNA_ID=CAMNT_0000461339 /DNA_START=299 /DNA_END=1282 /DNA_ORIENTATION=+ /assembly_acc=CAM_ASM_000160